METASQIAYLARAMKTPHLPEAAERLAERARDESWTHQEYLAAVLGREVAAREASGAEARIKAAKFPTRKSLDEFNFDRPHSGRLTKGRVPGEIVYGARKMGQVR